MNKRFYRNSPIDFLFDGIIYLLLGLMLIMVLYPLYFIVIASVSDPVEVNAGNVWLLPKATSLKGYQYVLKDSRLLTGYINTVAYSIGYMALSVILTLLAAYPLASQNLVGRRFFGVLFIIPMYFSGGLIPTYIVVKQLNLVNQPVLMCILGSLSVFYIIIARTFFETTIPLELNEAAEIDGCNKAQVFFSIALPLSKPIIAVLALYSFVASWNSYFNAMMFLSDSKYYPLQLVLREILILSQATKDSSANASIDDLKALSEQQKIADMIKYGVIVISAGPLLVIFPFFQKYFAQGMMVGAVKG